VVTILVKFLEDKQLKVIQELKSFRHGSATGNLPAKTGREVEHSSGQGRRDAH
jgi:hypothetical protein